MTQSLKGKTMIVTGASSGIGRAVARRFGAEGAKLALFARSESKLRMLADELGNDAFCMAVDLAKRADVESNGQGHNRTLWSYRYFIRQRGKLCGRRSRRRKRRRMGPRHQH